MLTLWRKWIAYPLGWVVLMLIALILLGFASGARPTYADMEAFHARYEAQSTGDQVRLDVEEEISVVLYNERGITRDLVTKYGESYLNITDVDVRDGSGEEVTFSEKRTSSTGDIALAIGGNDRVSGRHTYVISYTISNAMVGNARYQELYFNTNGTEWPNGFKEFSAELVLDDVLAQRLTGEKSCYRGTAGSRQRCELRQEGQTFRVDIDGGLEVWQNVTVAVGFQPDTVAHPLPPLIARSLGWWGIGILLGIGVLALTVSLLARAFVRDLKRGEIGVVTQFTAPEGLEPVLAADFLGRSEKGAAAHLAWLVLNGHGEITSSDERPGAEPGPGSDRLSRSQETELGRDLRLRWHQEGMTHRMRRITTLLFGDQETYLSLAQHRRTSDLFKAQHYRDEAVEDEYLRKNSALGPWMLWVGYLALIGFGWWQIWVGLAGLALWFLIAGVVASSLLLYAVHLAPVQGRLTKEGRDVRRHLMGLERFVTASEANRISWLQNAATAPREGDRLHLYERLLPWAIIFDAERSWADLVGDMYDRFPEGAVARFSVIALAGRAWSETEQAFYRAPSTRSRHSPLYTRADIGQGTIATGWTKTVAALSDSASGRGSSNTSTRSSGRGRSGGRSSGSRGGSSGRGSSGGGTGGGGGGRR